MAKYLDRQGVQTLWNKVKGITDSLESGKINASEKGVANGVATLDEKGKVPQSQLPSYVDDVLEYANRNAFPSTGESGKIYIAKDTNVTYRWSGSQYVEISSSLALGETSSTAYPGDKGKKLKTDFDNHVANKENPHGVTATQLGLGNVDNTTDYDKPISKATQSALDKINVEINKKLNKTDVINSMTNYDFVTDNDGLKILLFTPGKSGSVRVTGTTGDVGLTNPDMQTLYVANGSTNIGPGYTNVTISSGVVGAHSVNYDVVSGIATYRLYSTTPTTEISAVISFSTQSNIRTSLKLQDNGVVTTNNGIVADSAISISELETILV